MGMDTSGNIYELDNTKELQKQLKNSDDVILTEEQKHFLEHFPAEERYKIHKDLMSKNHNAKRRARRRIAKASRQRNRK